MTAELYKRVTYKQTNKTNKQTQSKPIDAVFTESIQAIAYGGKYVFLVFNKSIQIPLESFSFFKLKIK